MKYKYLSSPGSVFKTRLVLGVFSLVGLFLILSDVFGGGNSLFFGFYVFVLVYLVSRISTVKYNDDEIIIQNFRGKFSYGKDSFLSVKPLIPNFNLFKITFNDGKTFVFGLGSLRIFATTSSEDDAVDIEKALRYRTPRNDNE